jgi:hypothetical protein
LIAGFRAQLHYTEYLRRNELTEEIADEQGCLFAAG